MTPWIVWRIRRNPNQRWALTCQYRGCDVAYWTDASGRHDHVVQYAHRPFNAEEG